MQSITKIEEALDYVHQMIPPEGLQEAISITTDPFAAGFTHDPQANVLRRGEDVMTNEPEVTYYYNGLEFTARPEFDFCVVNVTVDGVEFDCYIHYGDHSIPIIKIKYDNVTVATSLSATMVCTELIEDCEKLTECVNYDKDGKFLHMRTMQRDGELHRHTGPAYIDSTGKKTYSINGVKMSKNKWSSVVGVS